MSLETIVKHIPGFSLLGRLAPTVLLATSITLACTSERRTEPTPPAAAYGCTTDKDCKGDRVCVEGDCIYPFEREERDVGRQYEDVEREIIDSGRLIEDANQQQDIGNGYEDSGREVIDSGGFVEDIGNVPECIDNDGDGYGIDCERGNDCDDENFAVHQTISCTYNGDSCGDYQLCIEECLIPPEEICDGLDNDCDGERDEGESQDYFECFQGDVYWFDSCGNIEERKEECNLYCVNERCVDERFIDLRDGTIQDNETNLNWEKVAPEQLMTYEEAFQYCSTLAQGVPGEWRIPTLEEFELILNREVNGNCNFYQGFEGRCTYYWSSDLCEDGRLYMLFGFVPEFPGPICIDELRALLWDENAMGNTRCVREIEEH